MCNFFSIQSPDCNGECPAPAIFSLIRILRVFSCVSFFSPVRDKDGLKLLFSKAFSIGNDIVMKYIVMTTCDHERQFTFIMYVLNAQILRHSDQQFSAFNKIE